MECCQKDGEGSKGGEERIEQEIALSFGKAIEESVVEDKTQSAGWRETQNGSWIRCWFQSLLEADVITGHSCNFNPSCHCFII